MSRAAAYGIAFGVALVVTLALTPLVRLLAIRIGAVVKPDERRVHQRPTPTIGGIAMFGLVLLLYFLKSALGIDLYDGPSILHDVLF